MGIFDYFKDRKEKKEIDRILDKVSAHQQAKDLVNKAISYRNINETQRAIKILETVLNKYPEYRAANSIYGNTLRQAGMIDEAIHFFKNIAEKDNGSGVYGPKEIYANIGLIYFFDKNHTQTALKYYKLALEAPECPSINKNSNEHIMSSIYRDLAYIFFTQNDYKKSKNYAKKRLEIQTKCPNSSKILGLSFINEFLIDESKLDFFDSKIENPDIVNAIEYLKITLADNDKDYAVLNGLALAYYLLSQMPYYTANKESANYINQEIKKYLNVLEKNSSEDKDAKYYFDMCNDLMMKIGIRILKHKHPNISLSYELPENE